MSTRKQSVLRGGRAVLNDQSFLNHRLVCPYPYPTPIPTPTPTPTPTPYANP